MPPLVDRKPGESGSSHYVHGDILSRLGETLSVSVSRSRQGSLEGTERSTTPAVPAKRVEPACHKADLDPERWDGLS